MPEAVGLSASGLRFQWVCTATAAGSGRLPHSRRARHPADGQAGGKSDRPTLQLLGHVEQRRREHIGVEAWHDLCRAPPAELRRSTRRHNSSNRQIEKVQLNRGAHGAGSFTLLVTLYARPEAELEAHIGRIGPSPVSTRGLPPDRHHRDAPPLRMARRRRALPVSTARARTCPGAPPRRTPAQAAVVLQAWCVVFAD
jgi:hypothetical protein